MCLRDRTPSGGKSLSPGSGTKRCPGATSPFRRGPCRDQLGAGRRHTALEHASGGHLIFGIADVENRSTFGVGPAFWLDLERGRARVELSRNLQGQTCSEMSILERADTLQGFCWQGVDGSTRGTSWRSARPIRLEKSEKSYGGE